MLFLVFFLFFFNDTATTEIYTLSLHDALPISFEGRSMRDVTAAVSWRASLTRSPPENMFSEKIRSEEHTSELQSLTNLVCRLLLEKKKKYKRNNKNISTKQSYTITSRRCVRTI